MAYADTCTESQVLNTPRKQPSEVAMQGNIRGRSSDNADDGSRCNGTHSADTS